MRRRPTIAGLREELANQPISSPIMVNIFRNPYKPKHLAVYAPNGAVISTEKGSSDKKFMKKIKKSFGLSKWDNVVYVFAAPSLDKPYVHPKTAESKAEIRNLNNPAPYTAAPYTTNPKD